MVFDEMKQKELINVRAELETKKREFEEYKNISEKTIKHQERQLKGKAFLIEAFEETSERKEQRIKDLENSCDDWYDKFVNMELKYNNLNKKHKKASRNYAELKRRLREKDEFCSYLSYEIMQMKCKIYGMKEVNKFNFDIIKKRLNSVYHAIKN